MFTIAEWLQLGTRRLADSPSARLDAELLLMHAAVLDRTQLITRSAESLDDSTANKYEALLARRGRGEPVAYITGTREFWSLPFHVSPAVLIPRPESELLVEAALAHIPREKPARVADLGTGSGAVAIAIAHERLQAHIVATDISTDALAIAHGNAVRHDCNNIEFRLGDWDGALDGLFDLIASNPPYVRSDDPHLQQGDLRFEPRSALVAGADGLVAIRSIAQGSRRHLLPAGWLALEHGYDQKVAVQSVLRELGYREIRTLQDYGGQDRVTEARL